MLHLTLQHKYGCHIENMSHVAIMLKGHADPTYLSISAKMQPTVAATLYIIAKNVPETILPVKYYIYTTYANYSMCRYETSMSIYIYIYILCQQGICPSKATNTAYAQIIGHAFLGEVWQYTSFIRRCSH